MGTPEEKGIKNLSVRRNLSNGLSIALMGISSVLGISGCSKEEKSHAMQEGNNIEIPLSDYPSSEENFILNDRRTNQEKIEIVKSVAPDDYRKEAALLAGEWERMGMDESDLEIVASIVDGKSWVLVARSRGDGRVFVPRINGVIQASLHLFGRLDEAGDFFDLVPVDVEDATVVGDGSGWHVVARVEGGAVVRWYDATRDEVRTVERAEPSPTPDARFQNPLPETWEECLKSNSYDYSDLETYHTALMEKAEEEGAGPTDFEAFTTGIPNADTEAEKKPSFITLHMQKGEGEENPFRSCEVFEKDGHRIVTLGIVTKRPGSDVTEVLYYAMDLTYVNQSRAEKGLEPYDFSGDYARMASGNFNEIYIDLILWRGSAEEGGVWDPLLGLQPEEFDNDPTVSQPYFKHLGDLTSAGHSTDGEAAEIFGYLDDYVLPCVSIGVIY